MNNSNISIGCCSIQKENSFNERNDKIIKKNEELRNSREDAKVLSELTKFIV
ncbi:hypothetical protein DICPUDRAFT_155799 [Dictyostelium purpureum]|uniref:Uncharacterized protein n=1 Tax=Dictyostelium purpureum TaxID=5786 RepID=F0ZUX2_DICPU|nr:uncharacterized protein DICPUDRAFT_155799 [Dictyostelium purpureum]EGC32252.1 hypothetical protein DICPUDRAFT_155799 [Dictyostelium purpureum]|eukprot:XP_003291219.1 hypothetical protein DICPUDRAFT_155799 [Dictyostelium purpureum]